jgi:hypothetical protein
VERLNWIRFIILEDTLVKFKAIWQKRAPIQLSLREGESAFGTTDIKKIKIPE